MRRGAKSPQNSTQGHLQSLCERLNALQKRLSELEERVSALEAGGDNPLLAAPQVPQKKRGRPRKIDAGELRGRRDRLVTWLESLWPKLAGSLPKAKSEDAVKEALTAYMTEEPARYITDRAGELCSFLKSNMFRRKPPKETVARALNGYWGESGPVKAARRLPTRQIASALAGVPELSWRRSLDICTREPCGTVIGRAANEHLRIVYGIAWPKSVWDHASQGEPQSQYWVGLSYSEGIGRERNPRVAAEWYQRAAMQGNGEAQFALANAYRKGHGLPKSASLAFVWAQQVPVTPECVEWKKEMERACPKSKLMRLKRLALELRGPLQKLQSATRLQSDEESKGVEQMNTLLREVDPSFKPLVTGRLPALE